MLHCNLSGSVTELDVHKMGELVTPKPIATEIKKPQQSIQEYCTSEIVSFCTYCIFWVYDLFISVQFNFTNDFFWKKEDPQTSMIMGDKTIKYDTYIS